MLTMFAVAIITVLSTRLAVEAVRWEERMTDADESILSQVVRERRERREELAAS